MNERRIRTKPTSPTGNTFVIQTINVSVAVVIHAVVTKLHANILSRQANAALATFVTRTRIAVVARPINGRIDTAARRITFVQCARITVVAFQALLCHAVAIHTLVAQRAGILVGARALVRQSAHNALAGIGIADGRLAGPHRFTNNHSTGIDLAAVVDAAFKTRTQVTWQGTITVRLAFTNGS